MEGEEAIMGRFADVPYKQRTDEQKAETQWGKAVGLLNRSDWSAAVVRCVTATEISLNLAIRQEHADRGDLTPEQVDTELHNANGVGNKLGMLRDLWGQAGEQKLKQLRKLTESATKKRNRIVHSGEFCDEEEARTHAENCRQFVVELVSRYHPAFVLTQAEIRPDEDLGA